MKTVIEEILEDFKIYLLETGKVTSKMTLGSYLGNIKQLLEWLELKEKEIEDLDRMLILKFLEYLRAKEYKANTYNTKINSITNLNSYLKDNGVIEKNIVFGKDKIRIADNRTVDVYAEAEMKLIEAYLESVAISPRDRLIIKMLKDLGLRASELVDLKLKDVDIVGQQVEVQGKNNKRRVLPIRTSLAEDIGKYISGDRKDNKNSSSKYLLVSERSAHLHRNTVLDVIKTMGKDLEIKEAYCHKFRKTLATSMINRNPPVPLPTVQKFLGHSDIKTTINHYTSIDEEQLRASIEGL